VAIDADCSAKETKNIIEELNKKYNLPIIWIRIDTPEEVILKRLNSSNKDRKYKGEKAIKNYYRRKELHLDLNQDFFYVFNGNGDLDAQVKDFVSKFITSFKI